MSIPYSDDETSQGDDGLEVLEQVHAPADAQDDTAWSPTPDFPATPGPGG